MIRYAYSRVLLALVLFMYACGSKSSIVSTQRSHPSPLIIPTPKRQVPVSTPKLMDTKIEPTKIEQEQERLAILPLVNNTGKNLTQSEVNFLTEVVRDATQALPKERFLVMRNESITLLLPKDVTLEDCIGECEVETGRRIGAHWLITGAVVKFGTSLRVTLSLFDTRKAQQLSSKITRGATVEDLESMLKRDTIKLLSILDPRLTHTDKDRTLMFSEETIALPKLAETLPQELQPLEVLDEPRPIAQLLTTTSALSLKGGASRFDQLDDLEGLTAYDKALQAENDEHVSPEERLQLWRHVADISPKLRPDAQRRAQEWETWIQQRKANRSKQLKELDNRRDVISQHIDELHKAQELINDRDRKRMSQRDLAWNKLSRILSLSDVVMPPSDKEDWIVAFIKEFGVSESLNPHIKDLLINPYLKAPSVQSDLALRAALDIKYFEERQEQSSLLIRRRDLLVDQLAKNEQQVASILGVHSQAMSGGVQALQVGSMVKVKPSVQTPHYQWGNVSYSSVGRIKEIFDDQVLVDFDDQTDWKAKPEELMLVSSETSERFYVGMKVRVKHSVSEPSYGWGAVSHESIGQISEISEDEVIVDFKEQANWSAKPDELVGVMGGDMADVRGQEIALWLTNIERSEANIHEPWSMITPLKLSKGPSLIELFTAREPARETTREPSLSSVSSLIGRRVRRGRDWKWEMQDGGAGSLGTITSEPDADGWVKVSWDKGGGNSYRMNSTHQDLVLVESAPSSSGVTGLKHRREFSSDVAWGDYLRKHLKPKTRIRAIRHISGNGQDVPIGALGTFYEAGHSPPAFVVWDNHFPNGCFEVGVNGAPSKDDGRGWCTEWADIEPL